MTIRELKSALHGNPEAPVRFVLPDKSPVAAHAHVTEVARIDKHFIDCGGTERTESLCRLQTWVAGDLDHRLTAGKLARILEKAHRLLRSDDLEVDVEHEAGWITQFPIASVEVSNQHVVIHLSARHTACLAQDQCCPPAPRPIDLRTITFTKGT